MPQFYKNLLRLCYVLLCSIAFRSTFAADIAVKNTNNSGTNSLAWAIQQANSTDEADRIIFQLPVASGIVSTIYLTTPLPAITRPLEIAGYTQAGAMPDAIATRKILININAMGMASGDVFTILSGDVTISGMAIYGSPGYAIRLSPSSGTKPMTIYGDAVYNNIFIWGNFIGTDNTGTTSGLGNKLGGIISNFGYYPDDYNANVVIGTNGDDVDDFFEGNLICASKGDGTGLNGDGILFWLTINSKIAGNYIGLDKNGTGGAQFGNKRFGVLLTVGSDGNVIGTEGDEISDFVEMNYISNNDSNGIVIGKSYDNTIAGNFIGLNINWDNAGNTGSGIQLLNSSNNVIGAIGDGVNDYARMNIIGYNGGNGIVVSSESFYSFEDNSANNLIAGNAIGTSDDASLNAGNGRAGILLYANFSGYGTNNNIIGAKWDAAAPEAMGNLIAHNQKGVIIRSPSATPGTTVAGNKLSLNSIFSNTVMGIDLGDDGISPNLAVEADGHLNAPVIKTVSVNAAGDSLTITGFTRPNTVVEFYAADAAPTPPPGFTKSFGQGQVFLFRAQDNATLNTIKDDAIDVGTYNGADQGTGVSGTISENKFSFSVPYSPLMQSLVTPGSNVLAVAYNNSTGSGTTSEFSANYSFSVAPVTLTSFTGKWKQGKSYLIWTTTNEVDNKHFEIEKSTDGKRYTKIGIVPGLGGVTNTYNFTDVDAMAAVNYYRLKQVDVDGKFGYSRVLVLHGDLGKEVIKVTPNPFVSQINVAFVLSASEAVRINLYDQSGRVVRTYNTVGYAGANNFNLTDVSGIPAGIYILEIKGVSTQLVKQVLKMNK